VNLRDHIENLKQSCCLLEMPHTDYNGQQSPLPGDPEKFYIIDFRLERQNLDPEVQKELRYAHRFGQGFVGKTKKGYLVFSDKIVRAATPEDLKALPHLPDDWRKHAVFVND
jgi:hypothetical protein